MKIEGHRLRAFFFKPILFILIPNPLTRGKERKVNRKRGLSRSSLAIPLLVVRIPAVQFNSKHQT